MLLFHISGTRHKQLTKHASLSLSFERSPSSSLSAFKTPCSRKHCSLLPAPCAAGCPHPSGLRLLPHSVHPSDLAWDPPTLPQPRTQEPQFTWEVIPGGPARGQREKKQQGAVHEQVTLQTQTGCNPSGDPDRLCASDLDQQGRGRGVVLGRPAGHWPGISQTQPGPAPPRRAGTALTQGTYAARRTPGTKKPPPPSGELKEHSPPTNKREGEESCSVGE